MKYFKAYSNEKVKKTKNKISPQIKIDTLERYRPFFEFFDTTHCRINAHLFFTEKSTFH